MRTMKSFKISFNDSSRDETLSAMHHEREGEWITFFGPEKVQLLFIRALDVVEIKEVEGGDVQDG